VRLRIEPVRVMRLRLSALFGALARCLCVARVTRRDLAVGAAVTTRP